LIVKHAELGGSYIVLYDELKRLSNNGFKNTSPAYAGFIQGVANAPGQAVSEIKKLEDELTQCKGDLFRAYLEAAAATGTYREFELLSKDRDKKNNEIIEKLNANQKRLLNNNEPNKLIDMLRNLAISSEDAATLSSHINEFEGLSSSLAEYQKENAKLEKLMADIDRDFHAQVVRLLSNELSARNQRGWVSRWLF